MWGLVHTLLRGILGRRGLSLREVYVGFRPDRTSTANQTDLANFVLVLAKSTVYSLLVCFYKEDRVPAPYELVLKARLKSRLLKEYAWYLGRGAIDDFRTKWCEKEALCSLVGGEVIFAPSLT